MNQARREYEDFKRDVDAMGNECYGYYVFYKEAEKMIPKIKEIFANDRRLLEEIKQRFVRQLNFINGF